MIIKMLVMLVAFGSAADDVRQEVVCAETGFSRAAEARDRDRFLSFVDPDARFVAGRVARGRAEIGEAWAAVLEPGGPAMRWRPAVVEVSADGRLALSRGPYRAISADSDGKRVETWGYFNSTWRKNAEGRWLVVFDSGGDAGMTPTDEDIGVLESEPDCSQFEF